MVRHHREKKKQQKNRKTEKQATFSIVQRHTQGLGEFSKPPSETLLMVRYVCQNPFRVPKLRRTGAKETLT